MIDDTAVSVDTAHTLARVDTLLARARLAQTALGVGDTLGPAAQRGVAVVAGQARAHGRSLALRALGVRTARRGNARVGRLLCVRCRPYSK